jgi:hypothetical protein
MEVKAHRAAALQNLAEGVENKPSRKRLGVRQPHAAFAPVLERSSFLGLMLLPLGVWSLLTSVATTLRK